MLFQLAVELIKLVIDLGLEYENIETIAIEVCEIIMANEGYRGDIICPGVVPNYGPHVSTLQTDTCPMFAIIAWYKSALDVKQIIIVLVICEVLPCIGNITLITNIFIVVVYYIW